jgi:hypothetical protein
VTHFTIDLSTILVSSQCASLQSRSLTRLALLRRFRDGDGVAQAGLFKDAGGVAGEYIPDVE